MKRIISTALLLGSLSFVFLSPNRVAADTCRDAGGRCVIRDLGQCDNFNEVESTTLSCDPYSFLNLSQRCCEPKGRCADGVGIDTALGCLKAGSPKDFISQMVGWGVVVGGGIAFVLIIIAGVQITTAAGDPKRVKAGQELLTAAIQGLLLIVFSLLLLNLIGFQILKLPGFIINL